MAPNKIIIRKVYVRREAGMKLLVLVLLIFFNGALFGYLESWVPEGQEAVTLWETDDFRAMRL